MVRAIDSGGSGTSDGMVYTTATGDDGNSYNPVQTTDYQQPTGGSDDPTTGGGSITDRPTWQVVVAVGAAAYVLGGKL